MRYPVAYAASQVSTTWQIVRVAPRSSWIHCGSEKALDHRVPVLPSTALPGGNAPLSVDDAVAGTPRALSVAVSHDVVGLPKTWSSLSEYPYGVPRAVPYILT